MEPRYPKSEPRPKLAIPVARIDIVLKERCSHLLKRCSLENPQRVIIRRTSERDVSKNRCRSSMRSSWNRVILANGFGGCSRGLSMNGSFRLSLSVLREVCDTLECFNMA